MLTDTQVRRFREEGYVLVPGIFAPAELDALEAAFDAIVARRLAARAQLDATWAGDWKDGIKVPQVVLHTHDVQAYSAAWTRALVHERFTEALSDCLGSPNVQLHHTKLFLKPPEKGAAFPMHQDAPYFPHERHTMMAAIVHLTDATEEMGCVRVVPGSHRLGVLELAKDETGKVKGLYLDPAKHPIEKATPCPANRGDVLFFSYLTIHGSGLNTSSRVRKTVLVQVRDPEDRPTTSQHPSHAQGLMLRGIDPLTARHTVAGGLEDRHQTSTPKPETVKA